MSESVVRVYIGLGCNLGERQRQLASACDALQAHPDITDVACSSLYETDPMGPADQPDYLNAVAGLNTTLSALELLDCTQSIELQHGRIRDGKRWGPRKLDLDLLLYGDQIINTPRLTVPHPGMAERSFVLLPLLELDPSIVIPKKGRAEILASQCQQFGIRRLNS